ncbi:MAG: hypothetical protein HKP48_09110 [Winogradskyella sp.]|uniref:hypothetical protein n=1 Tax=Winogradskyella sp. TaxID=1883156 RepID=UPI0018255A32|nr:hypothetical protein [Winogradskyella sp.]MBT8243822.1 hypothetical protein [Winogradskyella sp.]NNK23430.1 hypothetical protein [Winogradskyella sp.]
MKLTKDEIQFIDNYLKRNGIKYWDIRLEMIDHLVSDIESVDNSTDFETLFKNSLKNANWEGNLKDVNIKSWKSTNKIYRVKHAKEILSILKHPVYLIFFVLLYLGLSWIATSFPKALKTVSFVVLIIPIIVMLYESINTWRKKLGRSVNIDYGLFYFSFGIIMISTPLQLLPKSQLPDWLPIILSIYVLVVLAGYRLYRYALKKVLIIKNAL